MDNSLLLGFLILLSFSVLIVFFLQRLKLPSILGFLVTGIVIGPYGLSLVTEKEVVENMADVGVILLLFVIGLELSIKQLASIKKTVFIGGGLQIGLSVGLTAIIYHFTGAPWNQAVFIGFLASLSSTAVVLSILQDRGAISEIHGRNALAILIFQDIIAVPMMLVTPIMAGNSSNIFGAVAGLVIKSIIVIAITYVLARYVVPKLMFLIARTRSKELFLLTTITICFAVAYLTSLAGLSLALGAFLAGLIISESEFSHQATSIILPFRELFTSFFFISIGMLLNISFFIEHFLIVLGLVVVLFVIKGGATAIAVGVLKYPIKSVLLTAFALFEVGEFAFILSTIGIENNLLDQEIYQYFLAVSIFSMLLTPFVIIYSEGMADFYLRYGLVGRAYRKRYLKRKEAIAKENGDLGAELENHLIIVGYGINGRGVASAAKYSGVPFVVLETNAETVRREKAVGIPIIFGDAADDHILNHVNVYHARSVVIGVSNLEASKNIIRAIRSISQSVHIIIRTKYVRQIEELEHLGADEVVPEELEASIEIFSRILRNFLIPEDEITDFVEAIRGDNYHMLEEKARPKTFKSTQIPDFDITAIRVHKDSGNPIGRSLKELDLRAQYRVNVIAISRNNEMISNLQANEKILRDDLLYVQGDISHIEDFRKAIS